MNKPSKTYLYIQVLKRDREVLYDMIMGCIYLRLHNNSFIQVRGHDLYVWISHDLIWLANRAIEPIAPEMLPLSNWK